MLSCREGRGELEDSVEPVVPGLDDTCTFEVSCGNWSSSEEGERTGVPIEGEPHRERPRRSGRYRIRDADCDLPHLRNPAESKSEVNGLLRDRHSVGREVRDAVDIRRYIDITSEHGTDPLEGYSTESGNTTTVVAVEATLVVATAHIGSRVDCGQVGPDHGDGLGLLAPDVVDLLLDGSEHGCDGSGLAVIVDLTAELGDDLALAVDLGLHVAFLGVAELLDNGGLEVGDRVDVALACAIDGTTEGVGLLDGAELVLVTLGGDEELVLAAALAELAGEIGVARLDRVDDLEGGHSGLCGEGSDTVADSADTGVDEVKVLPEHRGEVLGRRPSGLTLGGDGVHQQLPAGVVVDLVGEETGAGSAIAAPSATSKETAESTVVDEGSEKEAEDTGAETSAPASETSIAAACEQPRPEVVVLISRIRNVSYICHTKKVLD